MQTMLIAALIYDFDLTLSPRYMQEYAYLPGIRMDPPEFWGACRDFQEANQVDGVLAYMYMVVEKAKGVMELTRGTFHQLGAQVEFFPGVEGWFERINAYGASIGVAVEHYIISSGLKEIIEGSSIAKAFAGIFAASFVYDANERPIWPATAVNYTAKTQYLFRINKGILDITNDEDLNDYTPEEKRRVPFPNMIYIGDGLTDVPCMKMVRQKGGSSIALHSGTDTRLTDQMILVNRADYATQADYRPGSELDETVRMQLHYIRCAHDCRRRHTEQYDRARARSGWSPNEPLPQR